MKRSVLTLVLVLGGLYIATAQQKVPTPVEIATKNIEAMEKKVKMSPTQRSIIYNYTLDLCKEQSDLSKKQQTGAFNEDDISRFYKKQNQTSQNIRNILKGDQQTDYDKFIEEQLRGGNKKKKKKGKQEEEEVVTGIEGLKLPPGTTVQQQP